MEDMKTPNRPFSYSEKNQNRTIFLLHFVEFSNVHNMVIEVLTPLDRALSVKSHENNARSRPSWRIAKRSIAARDKSNYIYLPSNSLDTVFTSPLG